VSNTQFEFVDCFSYRGRDFALIKIKMAGGTTPFRGPVEEQRLRAARPELSEFQSERFDSVCGRRDLHFCAEGGGDRFPV
tara:strand:+ start:313 stop:552 length:240 start_codon:yes stop_codon:yes gene_type:complete